VTTAIHPTAIVDPAAQIGRGVEIGAFCLIGSGAIIGDGSRLGPGVVVEGHTEIGPDCRVHAHAVLGGSPQDRSDNGEGTRLIIGARCVLREHVTIHRGTNKDRGLTQIGNDAYLMACAHVGHDCMLGEQVMLTNNVAVGGHVEIGDFVIIGGNSTVHQRCRIGEGAFVAGMCGVWADVIPFGFAIGDRAYLDGLNVTGMTRQGWDKERIRAYRRVYREIFHGPGLFAERVARLGEGAYADPDTELLRRFLMDEGVRSVLQPRKRGTP
jgi:UDP-N-acetylglucosamine acyltransferase